MPTSLKINDHASQSSMQALQGQNQDYIQERRPEPETTSQGYEPIQRPSGVPPLHLNNPSFKNQQKPPQSGRSTPQEGRPGRSLRPRSSGFQKDEERSRGYLPSLVSLYV